MTTKDKLEHLNLSNLRQHINNIDIHQIELFTKTMVNKLFSQYPSSQIQECVKTDQHVDIVTFLTHIIEVGSTKSIAVNKLATSPARQLEESTEIIAWIYNIILANELRVHQMTDIPCMGGDFYIYYSKNTLLLLVDRIIQHVSIAMSHPIKDLDLYADFMIKGDLA